MAITPDTAHADGAEVCGNCGTALQGAYCHGCGQSAHNPLHSLKHALEDVFESFWHLDGRVFGTLRDLFVPGRVARRYLEGQRARYIPPLRLFVVLSLITFFFGQLAVDDSPSEIAVQRDPVIAGATSIAAVRARESALVEEIRKAQTESEGTPTPGVRPALIVAEAAIRGQANDRVAELKRLGARADTDRVAASDTGIVLEADGSPDERAEAGRALQETMGERLRDPAKPWDAHGNPIDFAWLPAVGDRWANQRIDNALSNGERMKHNPGLFFHAMLGALPSALFVMVPVFALLLKIVYVGRRMGYLEHLVVALYSHAFLLIALMGMFVLVALGRVIPGLAYTIVSALGQLALLGLMPVYLLVMQQRVYGGRRALTALRYLALGLAYCVLVGFATTYAALAGLTG